MKIIIRLFAIVAFFLLGIAIIRISFGSQPIDTYSLLEYVSESPKLVPNTFTPTFYISGEWVILDGLRVFLNGLGRILSFIGYIAIEAVNLLGYTFYFFKFLFV